MTDLKLTAAAFVFSAGTAVAGDQALTLNPDQGPLNAIVPFTSTLSPDQIDALKCYRYPVLPIPSNSVFQNLQLDGIQACLDNLETAHSTPDQAGP